MNFSVAAATILALGKTGVDAFAVPSCRIPPAPTRLSMTPEDPYSSVVEAISAAADAANAAAAKSAGLAASLHAPDFDMSKLNIDMSAVDLSKFNIDMDAVNVGSINADALRERLSALEVNLDDIDVDGALSHVMTPEAIAAAHAKLELLEANLHAYADEAAMTTAIHDALDSSIAAAQHAAAGASALQANLADLDGALAHSMEAYRASVASGVHLLSPEQAEVAQAKLALLVHNLSGSALTLDDAFVANFLADVDRKLDAALAGVDSSVVGYATVAFALALSAKAAGKQGYKFKRTPSADELAKEAAFATISESAVKVTSLKYRVAAEKRRLAKALVDPVAAPAAPLRPAVAMAAMAGTTVEAPLEDPAVAMEALASEEVARARAGAAAKKPIKTDDAVAVQFSAASEAKVTILKKRMAAEKKRLAVTAGVAVARTVSASPLARLLADELGLDLSALGIAGSGKNGKILIDDVRQFQAQLEDAKGSFANDGSYFVTARA